MRTMRAAVSEEAFPTQTGLLAATVVAAPSVDRASYPTAEAPHSGDEPVIIIGGGPSGRRAAQEAARRGFPVILFNAERWRPYNRVKLTPFLVGEVQIGQVYQPADFPDGADVSEYTGHRIVSIDPSARTVTGQYGRVWRYRKLIICTGSRPHVPSIPGIDLPGIYTFRDFDDVEKLVARSFSTRRVVVIGGGLLGLEAARGMAARGIETVVVEHEATLMARQLDRHGGALLARHVSSMGLEVRVATSVQRIAGNGRVERVALSDGSTIPCDTVIVCTGIRPDTRLALEAGLRIGRGITVNDRMQTSDPDIYAVGECAEHDGHIHGLVSPGLQQAAAAVAHIAGEDAPYRRSLPSTKLKVVGVNVFSVGDVEQLDQRDDVVSLSWDDGERYRCLVLRHGRCVGALCVGDWPEINRLQQAVARQDRISRIERRRFRGTGRIWRDTPPASVIDWPTNATVCNCTGVTRGRLGEAIAAGCRTHEALRRETSASTVCESCKPLLLELLGGKAKPEPVAWFRTLLAVSTIAVLLTVLAVMTPPWPYAESVQVKPRLEILWIDGTWKQVTGFTLLGLGLLAALLSLRRRFGWLSFGGFGGWRAVHATIGMLMLTVLFAHTGFNMGSNLNFWLMATLLLTALLGAGSGIVVAIEHRLDRGSSVPRQPRAIPVWLHILALWPLPLLLTFHVLSVYFY